jgi:phage portal protein BeeE
MDYNSLIQRPFYQTKVNPATKSVGLSALDDFWYTDNPRQNDDTDPATLFRAVAWLYRGVQLRSNAVAAMPFRIMRGETEIDTSTDYQNALGWLPNPRRLIYMTEAALTCYGRAYWLRETNRVTTKGVRYVRPDTIEPIIEASGLPASTVTATLMKLELRRLVRAMPGFRYIRR